eukprot:1394583-Pleurochrysis_carterae.AAC.3
MESVSRIQHTSAHSGGRSAGWLLVTTRDDVPILASCRRASAKKISPPYTCERASARLVPVAFKCVHVLAKCTRKAWQSTVVRMCARCVLQHADRMRCKQAWTDTHMRHRAQTDVCVCAGPIVARLALSLHAACCAACVRVLMCMA